jgi:RNA polymerase sigma-70 factor (ECF subfamily)
LEQEQVFTKLITENQGIIHKVCNIYCKNEGDRADLFQEIVLQLWKSYGSFQGRSKISTWMYRIALNTAITSFRKQKKNKVQQQLSLQEFQIPDIYPDEDFEEKLAALYQAIRQLSKVERAVIMLYLEDKSYQEMAEILGISESNVGVKLNRVKKKLKKIIKPELYGVK